MSFNQSSSVNKLFRKFTFDMVNDLNLVFMRNEEGEVEMSIVEGHFSKWNQSTFRALEKIWVKSSYLENISLTWINPLEDDSEFDDFAFESSKEILDYLNRLNKFCPRRVSSFSVNKYFAESPAIPDLITDWNLTLKKVHLVFLRRAETYLFDILHALMEKTINGINCDCSTNLNLDNPFENFHVGDIFKILPVLTRFTYDIPYSCNSDSMVSETASSFVHDYSEDSPKIKRELVIRLKCPDFSSISHLKFYGRVHNKVFKRTDIDGVLRIEDPMNSEWTEQNAYVQFIKNNLGVVVKLIP